MPLKTPEGMQFVLYHEQLCDVSSEHDGVSSSETCLTPHLSCFDCRGGLLGIHQILVPHQPRLVQWCNIRTTQENREAPDQKRFFGG